MEQLIDFLKNSYYRPDKPEEFEIVGIKITYEEEMCDVDSQSGTEESEIALGH